MISTFDSRIILLLYALTQGLAGLRLNKVSIPAYKLRGESAFLECQYELNGPKRVAPSNSRPPHNQHGGGGGDLHYVDTDSATVTEELPVYRRMRTHPYSQQRHRQQHQQQPYHYFQSGDAGSAAASVSAGGFYPTQHQTQANARNVARSFGSARKRNAYQDSMTGAGSYTGGRRVSASTYDSAGGGEGGRVFNVGHTERDVSLSAMESDELDGDGEEEGEALYAVKWYKDNEEFYRFVPKANPPKQSYRVDGIRVIEEHSDSSRVLLRGLTLNSTGLYRCEVSAEAPNFSSVQGEGRMDIVYLPRDGPHIKGQQFQYQIGEILNLNCTSGKSHPASHLQWFINEQPVLDGRFLASYNDTVHKHGLITSALGLQLTVDARHFFNGAMKVKCLASISPVLWKGGKESVLQRRPGIIDNREAMLLVRSTAAGLHQNLKVSSLIFLLSKLSQLLLHTALR